MATILHLDQTITRDVTLTFEEIQRAVGGYVTLVRIPDDPTRQLAVNEEGDMLQLAYNEKASQMVGQTIVGTAVVVDNGEVG